MKRLPLLVSLPHAGLEIPSQVADLCVLVWSKKRIEA